MALRGNNFVQAVKFGTAIPAQSITAATVNGNAISEPWRDGRQLSFVFVGGAFVALSSGRLKVQGLRRDDGTTWEDIQTPAGVDLEFEPTKLDDAGAGENGTLIGTIDMADVDGVTYKSLRAQYIEETAAVAQIVAVAYIISDLYERPSGMTDELFALQRPIDTP